METTETSPRGDCRRLGVRRGESALEYLERLERERYLVLRSLRIAHALLARAELERAQDRIPMDELLAFMRGFVMDHFFTREEALLEAWARRERLRQQQAELEQLRHQHELGRAILQSVAEAMGQRARSPRARVDLGKLITHLSESLMRGQHAVHRVEVRLTRGKDRRGLRELERSLPAGEGPEERYLRLIEELERRCGEG